MQAADAFDLVPLGPSRGLGAVPSSIDLNNAEDARAFLRLMSIYAIAALPKNEAVVAAANKVLSAANSGNTAWSADAQTVWLAVAYSLPQSVDVAVRLSFSSRASGFDQPTAKGACALFVDAALRAGAASETLPSVQFEQYSQAIRYLSPWSAKCSTNAAGFTPWGSAPAGQAASTGGSGVLLIGVVVVLGVLGAMFLRK